VRCHVLPLADAAERIWGLTVTVYGKRRTWPCPLMRTPLVAVGGRRFIIAELISLHMYAHNLALVDVQSRSASGESKIERCYVGNGGEKTYNAHGWGSGIHTCLRKNRRLLKGYSTCEPLMRTNLHLGWGDATCRAYKASD